MVPTAEFAHVVNPVPVLNSQWLCWALIEFFLYMQQVFMLPGKHWTYGTDTVVLDLSHSYDKWSYLKPEFFFNSVGEILAFSIFLNVWYYFVWLIS